MSLTQEHFKRVKPGLYVPKRGWHYNSSHLLPNEEHNPDIAVPCIVRVGPKWKAALYDNKTAGTSRPYGSAHSTLERAVQDFLGSDRPLQIRPLQKAGPKKWQTNCRQFMIIKCSDGWRLDFISTICTLVWPQLNVDESLIIWSDWCARHGLDGGLDTLKEVLERLETAERADPIRQVGSLNCQGLSSSSSADT